MPKRPLSFPIHCPFGHGVVGQLTFFSLGKYIELKEEEGKSDTLSHFQFQLYGLSKAQINSPGSNLQPDPWEKVHAFPLFLWG